MLIARNVSNTGGNKYVTQKFSSRHLLTFISKNAFRQNIMQMRDTATSILSQPNHEASRSSSRDGISSLDSHAPILQHAATKSSGLRHYTSEDGDDDSFITEGLQRRDGRF
jgi:hypothetical protein